MSAGAVESVPRALDSIESGLDELESMSDDDLSFVDSQRFSAICARLIALMIRCIGRTSAVVDDDAHPD